MTDEEFMVWWPVAEPERKALIRLLPNLDHVEAEAVIVFARVLQNSGEKEAYEAANKVLVAAGYKPVLYEEVHAK